MLIFSDFLIKTVYILLLERLNFVRIEKQKEKSERQKTAFRKKVSSDCSISITTLSKFCKSGMCMISMISAKSLRKFRLLSSTVTLV